MPEVPRSARAFVRLALFVAEAVRGETPWITAASWVIRGGFFVEYVVG